MKEIIVRANTGCHANCHTFLIINSSQMQMTFSQVLV